MKKTFCATLCVFLLFLTLFSFSACSSGSSSSASSQEGQKNTTVKEQIKTASATASSATSKASDLPPTTIELFEGIRYSFDGMDGLGTITFDTSYCPDIIKENVTFSIEDNLNGKLSNNQKITIHADCEDSFLRDNNYTAERNSIEIEVEHLYMVGEALDFSEDKAWVLLHDIYPDTDFYTYSETSLYIALPQKPNCWVCIDQNGNPLFQIEDKEEEITSVTPYEGGFSYVSRNDGSVILLDADGNIVNTFWPDDCGEILAFGGGYVFSNKKASDFDSNYDLFRIYDCKGELCREFTVTDNGKAMTDSFRSVKYCGDGNFVMDNRYYYPTWFYCAKSDTLITDTHYEEPVINRVDDSYQLGCTNDTMCIGITRNYENETVTLSFLSSSGEVSTVSINALVWYIESYLDDDSLILSTESGKIMRYDTLTKKTSLLDDHYADKVDWDKIDYHLVFKNGHIALPLKGADGETYAALFDKNWNAVIEPIKCERILGYSGSRLVLEVRDKHSSAAIYDNDGNLIFNLLETELAKQTDVYYDSFTTPMYGYSNGYAVVSGDYTYRQDLYYTYGDKEVKNIHYIDENGNILFESLMLDEAKVITLDK